MGLGDFFRRWLNPPAVEVDYSSFSDERLQELEAQAAQLTEEAVTRLFAELDKRGLRAPPPPFEDAPIPVEEPDEAADAPDLDEPFRITPGGCVRLYLRGKRSVLCVLPTTAEDAARAVGGLQLDPDERVEALVVIDHAEGFFATDALAAHFNLLDSAIHYLHGRPPRPAAQKFGDRLELGHLTLLREPKQKGIVRAFWFGVDGTLMIGARLPFDAWLLTPFPTHVAGTLEPPRGAADVKRLERAGENDAWSYVRTVTLMRDVVGATADPYATRLPEFGVQVRQI